MINKSDCRIKRSNASFITEKHFLFIVGRVYIALHILRSWTDSLRLTCVCLRWGGGGGCMLGWRRGVTVLSSTSRLFHQEKLEIASDCLLANMPYAPSEEAKQSTICRFAHQERSESRHEGTVPAAHCRTYGLGHTKDEDRRPGTRPRN